jgi:glutathione S-transferase
MAYTLLIGNKNYSSWSLRTWLALTEAGLPFTERLVSLQEIGRAHV